MVGIHLEKIKAALGSVDESLRCCAVEDLQQLTSGDRIPLLLVSLQDRSARVREAAAAVLESVGGASVADAMAKLLGSENVPARNAAMEILEKLGQPSLKILEEYVNSPSVDVRKFAIDTIGKILAVTTGMDATMGSALSGRLYDADLNVAGAAAEALGNSKDDSIIQSLVRRLSEPSLASWVQCTIIVALSGMPGHMAREAILKIDRAHLSDEASTFLEQALKSEAV